MARTEQPLSAARTAIRGITLSNFVVAVLFVIPPAHRFVDRGFVALKAIGLEDVVGQSLQIWLVGSTLFATALLLWMLRRTRRAIAAGVPSSETVVIEGVLVTVWWLVVLGACAYGFILGMGG